MREDVSIALLHDAVHGRQAKPGAFAFFFGGEEGLEDAGLRFLVHAMPGIGNRDHGIAPGLDETVLAEIFADGDISALQRKLAALGHGIFGIDDQVHDDLLELAGVGAGVTGLGGEPGHQLDVFADQRAEQPLHVADDGVDVDYFQFQHLLAAEGQQLPSQSGRPIGRLLNGLHFIM